VERTSVVFVRFVICVGPDIGERSSKDDEAEVMVREARALIVVLWEGEVRSRTQDVKCDRVAGVEGESFEDGRMMWAFC
jgi:hypothetical protein